MGLEGRRGRWGGLRGGVDFLIFFFAAVVRWDGGVLVDDDDDDDDPGDGETVRKPLSL